MQMYNSEATPRLKVAVIEPVGGHGGMDFYGLGLCKGLKDSGINPTLYTCEKTEVPTGCSFPIIHAYKGVFGSAPRCLRGAKYIKSTFSALLHARSQNNTICHFHIFQSGFLECFQVLLAKIMKFHVVITAHDIEPLTTTLKIPLLGRCSHRLADRVIVHNRWSKKELIRCMGDISDKTYIIPHGNYIDFLGQVPEKSEARNNLKIDLNRKVILFFGQIKQTKGLDLLLYALARLRKKHPDILLLITGKVWKDNYAMHRQIIQKFGLQSCCLEEIRYIKNEEVGNYFAASDLVVLPYRRVYQSGVLLMAMSYRRPVLVSKLQGMENIVEDGVTGYLFQSGDVRSLSSKIERIFSDHKKMNFVSENAYRMVTSKFDWKKIGFMTAACYRGL